MLIAPFYDTGKPAGGDGFEPIIAIDGTPDDVATAFVRQRRRMAEVLSSFTGEQWRTPSRCDGWTAQDVIAHLVGTNGFWRVSMEAGLAGEPTRYLGTGFDPKATPAAMVDSMQALTPAQTFEQFCASNDALCTLAEKVDVAGWAMIAETPPGHLPMRLLAHHALWDAWVHERDILLPLGIDPVLEDDEILASLRYAVALGPSFALASDPTQTGSLVLEVTDPDATIVVEVDGTVRVHDGAASMDSPVLRGDAIEVLEMLSIRRPFAGVPDEARPLLEGLAEVFETTG